MNDHNKIMREVAQTFRDMDIGTMPIIYGRKEPAIETWKPYQENFPTKEEYDEWYSKGRRNIAIITGSISGVLVLDVDKDEAGNDGHKFLTDNGIVIPNGTPCVRTGGGGCQYYFKTPDFPVAGTIGLGELVDVRAEGNYAIAPPSVHPSGNSYVWEEPFDRNKLSDVPPELLKFLKRKADRKGDGTGAILFDGETAAYGKTSLAGICNQLASVKQYRNDALNKAAFRVGQLVGGEQINAHDGFSALLDAAKANGYIDKDGEDTTIKTIRSGLTAGLDYPRYPEGDEDRDHSIELPKAVEIGICNGDRITEKTLAAMREFWKGSPHKPSDKFWEAYRQNSRVFEAMVAPKEAHSAFDPSAFYLSSLACGTGKTTTLIHNIKILLSMPEYNHVGIIIFLEQKEMIEKMIKDIGLQKDQIAVITKDRKYNDLGCGQEEHDKARVLFTTQAQLTIRCQGGKKFCDIQDFYYNWKPRQVRVWDEAMLPGKDRTLERKDIQRVVALLADLDDDLYKRFDEFHNKLQNEYVDNQVVEVPGVDGIDVSLADIEDMCRHEVDVKIFQALWALRGKPVKVKKNPKDRGTIIQYEDILPDDLAPFLILDAAGHQRRTYVLWSKYRRNLKYLYSPPKDYSPFEIYHVDKGGAGKDRLKNPETRKKIIGLASEIINTEIPDTEQVLVISHKPKGKPKSKGYIPNIGTLIRSQVTKNPDRVKFTTWGMHTATNGFKDIKYVIMIGVLQLPGPTYEIKGLAAAGLDLEEPLSDGEIAGVRYGESLSNIMQGANRIHVRYSEGDSCPPGCHLYIFYSKNNIKGSPLEEIFPGAVPKEWRPELTLTEKQQLWAEAVVSLVGQTVMLDELIERCGGVRKNFLRDLDDNQQIRKYLKTEEGIDFTVDRNKDAISVFYLTGSSKALSVMLSGIEGYETPW